MFVPTDSTRITFCGRPCYYRHKAEQGRYRQGMREYARGNGRYVQVGILRACRLCGRECWGKWITLCSEECTKAYNLSIRPDTLKAGRERYYANRVNKHTHCTECGAWMGNGFHNGRRYCDGCAERRHEEYVSRYRKSAAGKAARRSDRSRRRARMRGVKVVAVPAIEIFGRDEWKCQRCRRKTRPDWNMNHNLYPTMDHIIPLSRGGEHLPSNIQTLCRRCNTSKGVQVGGDQLLLDTR